jgi:hypothetical protein
MRKTRLNSSQDETKLKLGHEKISLESISSSERAAVQKQQLSGKQESERR